MKKRSITPQQWLIYAGAKQIAIELPEKLTKKQLWQHYHLDYSPDDESNGENAGYDFFWNSDLRSGCGFIHPESLFGDWHYMILFPRYYAEWNPEQFKRLLEEAESLRPEWGDLVGGAISRIEMPKLP